MLKLISVTERRGEWQKKTENINLWKYKQRLNVCACFTVGLKMHQH
jgi:hypothetical protein